MRHPYIFLSKFLWLLMLCPALAQAQCPALGTITPVSPSCVGGSNGQIQVNLLNVSGLYNITLLQEVGSVLMPVQSFANQSANPFVFSGLSASDRYAVFVSFPLGNQPPPGCDAFLVSGSVNVADPPPFVPTVGPTLVVCAGSSGQLSASGAVSYTWSPADFLSDPNAANPIANPPVTTTYTLTAISANGCVGTATQIVEVTPLPEVIFNLSPTLLCASAAPITLNASPAGGVFSGPGVSGNSFNPAVAGVGMHEIIYSYTENGCNVSRSQSIEVSPTPILSFALPISSVCLSGSSIALNASPVGGVFSGPGVSGTTFSPAAAGVGTHNIVYTFIENGCTVTSSQSITVVADAVLAISNLADNYCVDSEAFEVLVSPMGGTLSGAGISGTTFNPAAAGLGTHTITYTFIADNCTFSISRTVEVRTPNQSVSIDNLAATYCISAPAFALLGSPVGGTFSGPGVSSNNFNPSAAGLGTHIIRYTYDDGNCLTTISRSVTVVPAPPAAFFTGLPSAYCLQAAPLTLTGNPSGGVFSGPGISGNVFDPAVAGLGTHTITYTYTENNCTSTASQNITVTPLPTAQINNLSAAYCLSAAVVNLVGMPAGGTFSGPGVSGNNFNPSAAGLGTHLIVYTFSQNGCTVTAEQSVSVTAPPTVSFSGLSGIYCEGSGLVTLTGSPLGGTFSGPGISGNTFNPAAAGIGLHTITYTFSQNNCTFSSSQQVEVVAGNEVLSITGLESIYCVNAAAVSLTGSPLGGTFSGPGISGNSFNPALAGVGTHLIVYEYVSGGCTSSISQTVEVVPALVLTIAPLPAQYCIGAPALTLSASPSGGVFSGNGVSGNSFNPSAAGLGVHQITYTFSENGCTESTSLSIEVVPVPVLSIAPLPTQYCLTASPLTLSASPSGGVFSGNGVSGNSFNPSMAGLGVHQITYTFSENGCTESTSLSIEVVPAPVLTIAPLPAQYCLTASPLTLSASPSGGIFLGSGVSGNVFNPSAAGLGVHQITYTFSENGCTESISLSIEVVPTPTPVIDPLPASRCLSAAALTLSASPSGGVFSGPGVSGNSFDPLVAGLGTHIIRYTFTLAGCTAFVEQSIVVTPTPTPLIAPLPAQYCLAAAPLALAATPVGGVFSGNGVVGNEFFPALAGLGMHLITYTFSENGCTATHSRSIVVTATPVLSIAGLAAVYCSSDSPVTLTGSPTGGIFSGAGVVGNTFNPALAGEGIHPITYTYSENGCTLSIEQSVEVVFCDPCAGVQLSADLEITAPNRCGGSGALLVTNISGGTAAYSLSIDGSNFQSETLFENLLPGSYTLVIRDAIGCTSSLPFEVLPFPELQILQVENNAVSCQGATDGQLIIAQVRGGSGNYEYSLNGIDFQSSNTFLGLAAGTYILQVRDDADCMTTQEIIITEPALLEAQVGTVLPSDCGNSDGQIQVLSVSGGNGGYEYALNGQPFGSNPSFTNLPEGNYTLQVRDSRNCIFTINIALVVPNTLSATINSNVGTCGQSNGQILVENLSGGSGAYEFSLDNVSYQASPLFTNLPDGNYTVYVKDANGNCRVSYSVSLQAAPALSFSLSTSLQSNCIVNNGQIVVSTVVGGTAPYQYSLNGVSFQNGNTFSNLAAGSYTVYVRDANNCVLTASATVAAPAALSLLNPQVFAPSCSSAAGNDGRIVVAAVQGGTPPYQFSLDGVNFQSNGNFSNLSSGLYTLVVRDAVGCTGSQVLTMPAPVSLQFQVQQIQAATCGQSNGALEVLNVTGGSGTYFYSLDGQSYQSSPVFSNIPANIYTVYVRDATLPDCVFRRTMVVDGTLALGFEATAQNIACGASVGSILVENIQGGTLPYQLVLSQNGGQTREVTIFANQYRFEGLEEGVYILRVQDQSACAVQPRTLLIQKANALRAKAEASLSLVEEPTGTIFISELSGGFAPYQLSIDGGQSFVSFSGQDTLLTGLGIGTYRVVIRDGFQCQWTKELAVLESTFLIPNIMTPNNDGKNDYFRIRNLPAQGASLRISNRWGRVVYSSNNYQNDWDGGDNPDGVYYYTLQVPEMGTFSGWIQIWR